VGSEMPAHEGMREKKTFDTFGITIEIALVKSAPLQPAMEQFECDEQSLSPVESDTKCSCWCSPSD
jgi:hypothetical protein